MPSFSMRAAANKNSVVRMLHVGVGGIGGMQRGQLKSHKKDSKKRLRNYTDEGTAHRDAFRTEEQAQDFK